MKKITSLLFIILIVSCNNDSKRQNENTENEFTINVNLDNLKDSLTVVLANMEWRNRDYNIIDSTYTYSGKFNFKGEIQNPSLHTILIKDYKNKKGERISIWFENGEITINGNYDDFENSSVTGSPLNKLYRKYKKLDRKDKYNFLYTNPNNYFSLTTIIEDSNWISKDSLKLFYSKIDDKLRISENGIALNGLITPERIEIGDIFKDFEALDLNGNKVKLSDFKGKVILIDFWANWCHVCHEQNQEEFQYLNKKYNKDEFVLISYSLDTKRELWEKSSKADNIDWINISNLKGMNDPITALFGVQPLPHSFLIDRNGVIVKEFRGYHAKSNIIEQEIDKLIGK